MKSSNFICTIGPTNNSAERIERMIYKGMSTARLNVSHGTLEEHQFSIQNLRLAAKRCEERSKFFCPLAIAIDIRGPEIRIGKVEKTLVKLRDQVKLNENPNIAEDSSAAMIYVDYPLSGKLKKNSKIFIGDGSVGLKVEEIFGVVITCRVFKSGTLSSSQSVTIPELQAQLNLPVISQRDRIALQFAVDQDVDFVFASHVESGEWIDDIRECLGKAGNRIQVFAKIQNQFAVEKIEEIIERADGIVIAPTTDLNPILIPFLQRKLQNICRQKMKPCLITIEAEFVAAEVYQAVNWLLESGDGIVITREAAEGKFNPIESMMLLKHVHHLTAEITGEEENSLDFTNIERALASACVSSSILTKASAIILTSDKLSYHVYNSQPKCEILVMTQSQKKARQLNILNNLTPLLFIDKAQKLSKFKFALKFGKARGAIKSGDAIVLLKKTSMEVHYVPYDS